MASKIKRGQPFEHFLKSPSGIFKQSIGCSMVNWRSFICTSVLVGSLSGINWIICLTLGSGGLGGVSWIALPLAIEANCVCL